MDLDLWEVMPSDMRTYLRNYGWNFSRKACDFAVSLMKKKNHGNGKLEKIQSKSKEEVDEMLKQNGVVLENNVGYNHVYVCNMGIADFYRSCIEDERHLSQFVKDVIDDADAEDGMIFSRFYSDCCKKGIPIDWEEIL